MEQGYHVAVIRHGKGNKRGLAKLSVKVRQIIDDCLIAAGREHATQESPLFVSFRKGDHREGLASQSGRAYREASCTGSRDDNVIAWDTSEFYYTGV